MEKAVDNLKKDLAMTMEIEESLKMATPIGCFLTSTSHTGPSDSTPRIPSIEESLQSAMDLLENVGDFMHVCQKFLNKLQQKIIRLIKLI